MTWAGRIDVDRQFFNFGAYGAIAFTVLGGVLLVQILGLRRPADAAAMPADRGA